MGKCATGNGTVCHCHCHVCSAVGALQIAERSSSIARARTLRKKTQNNSHQPPSTPHVILYSKVLRTTTAEVHQCCTVPATTPVRQFLQYYNIIPLWPAGCGLLCHPDSKNAPSKRPASDEVILQQDHDHNARHPGIIGGEEEGGGCGLHL